MTKIMKASKSIAGVIFAPLFLATVSYACIKPVYVTGALDAVQIACILVSDIVEDDHVLAQMCGVSEELLPEIRKIVLARKTAAAHKASAAAAVADAAGDSTREVGSDAGAVSSPAPVSDAAARVDASKDGGK